MKKLSLLLAFTGLFFSTAVIAQNAEIPAKTVLIKNPGAENAATFFSSSMTYFFEVYKSGGQEGNQIIIKSFEQDPAVASILPGTLTGEYQAFALTLKTPQTKGWFSTAFKNA